MRRKPLTAHLELSSFLIYDEKPWLVRIYLKDLCNSRGWKKKKKRKKDVKELRSNSGSEERGFFE